jgi:hypothetical protein
MPKKKNPPSKKGQSKKKDKKGKGIPNQKEEKKKKIKIDKTFGLKNKKGKANAQYVRNMKNNMAATDKRGKKKSRNKALEEQQKLQSEFWGDGGGVGIIQKKTEGDPKEILCEFFKAGKCTKKFRCKFSHDLCIEQKVRQRKLAAAKEAEMKKTMDDMTQMELEDVIRRKLRKRDKQTDIVCNYFLDALESRVYGMRWKCPNGVLCQYRHALPKGWKLKDPTTTKESIVRESLEETLENMRKEFYNRTDLTPVTAETFAAWKIKREKETAEEAQRKLVEATQKKVRLSKVERQLSGRQLFEKFSVDDGKMSVQELKNDLPKVDEDMEFDESLFVDDDEPVQPKVSQQQVVVPKAEIIQKVEKKTDSDDMEFDESLFMDDF